MSAVYSTKRSGLRFMSCSDSSPVRGQVDNFTHFTELLEDETVRISGSLGYRSGSTQTGL